MQYTKNGAGKGITAKEWLFYLVLFGTVFFALLIPAFVYIVFAKNNPELVKLFGNIADDAKSQVITELTEDQSTTSNTTPQRTQPPVTTNNSGSDVVYADERYFLTLTQSVTDVYENNGKKLYYASYPSFCNAGYIYGDYTQFNSQKCYYEGDINTLRALFKSYFTQKQTAQSLVSIEDQILAIINQGAPYDLR